MAVAALPDPTDRSLRLHKDLRPGAATAQRVLPEPLTGTVEVTARVRVESAAGWANVLYVAGSDGASAASLAIRAGEFLDDRYRHRVGCRGGWALVRRPRRAAYRRASLRRVRRRCEVADWRAVPGGRRGRAPDRRRDRPRADRHTQRRQRGGAATPHPTVAYHAFDLFDDAPVGATPPGYAVTGAATVAAVPSGADRSLQISKTQSAGEAACGPDVHPPLRHGDRHGQPAHPGNQPARRWRCTPRTPPAAAPRHCSSPTASCSTWTTVVRRLWSAVFGRTSGTPSGWCWTYRAAWFAVFVDGLWTPAVVAGERPSWHPFRDTQARDIARLRFGIGAQQSGTLRVDRVLVYENPVAQPVGAVEDVRAHGATGDGRSDHTAAVQAAINAAPVGGTVLLSSGVFRTGTIRLKSNLTLWVAPDAMLLGTWTASAYPDQRATADPPPFLGGSVARSLIFGHRMHDVVIEGGGVIHGNGRVAWVGATQAAERDRPSGIFLARSSNVTIRNVHIVDAALGRRPGRDLRPDRRGRRRRQRRRGRPGRHRSRRQRRRADRTGRGAHGRRRDLLQELPVAERRPHDAEPRRRRSGRPVVHVVDPPAPTASSSAPRASAGCVTCWSRTYWSST